MSQSNRVGFILPDEAAERDFSQPSRIPRALPNRIEPNKRLKNKQITENESKMNYNISCYCENHIRQLIQNNNNDNNLHNIGYKCCKMHEQRLDNNIEYLPICIICKSHIQFEYMKDLNKPCHRMCTCDITDCENPIISINNMYCMEHNKEFSYFNENL